MDKAAELLEMQGRGEEAEELQATIANTTSIFGDEIDPDYDSDDERFSIAGE